MGAWKWPIARRGQFQQGKGLGMGMHIDNTGAAPTSPSPAGESERTTEDLKTSLAALTETVEQLLSTVEEIRSLVGPFGVPMPGGAMLVQTIHGMKYLIDPNDRVMAPQLIVYRQWEPDLSALFLRNLAPSSVVVDVGANFGYFTCLAASRIGAGNGGEVFAFEPNPRLLPLLRDNCAINWSMAPVHIHEAAVGATRGVASLSIPRGGAANASLTDLAGDAERLDVAVVTLDEALPHGLLVDFLKIDVEGHEMAVLQGARDVIGRSPNLRIVMEWSIDQMGAAGTSVDDMLGLFAALGLSPRGVPSTGLIDDALPISVGELRTTGYANIVLVKAG